MPDQNKILSCLQKYCPVTCHNTHINYWTGSALQHVGTLFYDNVCNMSAKVNVMISPRCNFCLVPMCRTLFIIQCLADPENNALVRCGECGQASTVHVSRKLT